MSEPVVFQKAPIVQQAKAGTVFFCACGRSATQPTCDGSHQGTGIGPLKVDLEEPKTVAWCGCKHSQDLPWCDGSHSRLP